MVKEILKTEFRTVINIGTPNTDGSLNLKTSIEFICGDSLKIMASMEPNSIDVITTSPPYNLGIDYRSHDDTSSREDYLTWTAEWLKLAYKVLAPDGSLFLNIGGKPTSPWGPYEVLACARSTGYYLQNRIAWIKAISIDYKKEILSTGHYKPINSNRFINDCWEDVFHLTKTGEVPLNRIAIGVPFQDKNNLTRGGRGKHGDLRCRGNTWFIPYETIQSKDKDRPHPATFPPRLAEMTYLLHGVDRIKKTLDPFSGLGSSARASANLGLNHIAIEIDPTDHKTAIDHIFDGI